MDIIKIGHKETGVLTFTAFSTEDLINKALRLDITGFNVSANLRLTRSHPKIRIGFSQGILKAMLTTTKSIEFSFEFTNDFEPGAKNIDFLINGDIAHSIRMQVYKNEGLVRYNVTEERVQFVIADQALAIYIDGEKAKFKILNGVRFVDHVSDKSQFDVTYKTAEHFKYKRVLVERIVEGIYPTLILDNSIKTNRNFTLYRGLNYHFLNDGQFYKLDSPFKNVRQLTNLNRVVANSKDEIIISFPDPVNHMVYAKDNRVLPFLVVTNQSDDNRIKFKNG